MGREGAEGGRREGEVRVAWSGKDEGFTRVPDTDELLEALDRATAYVHVTTNETIQGVESRHAHRPRRHRAGRRRVERLPVPPEDIARYGVLYAGAQKNAGPAGLTLAIVRDDVLARVPEGLPTLLDYRTYAEHGSLYNTPPVFSIYVFLLVTRWLRNEVGGLDAMHRRNRHKAGLLYGVIDDMPAFYRGHATAGSRSV